MTKICRCASGSHSEVDDCTNCKKFCGNKKEFSCVDKDHLNRSTFLGINIITFIITSCIVFVISGLTIYYMIRVLSHCHNENWFVAIVTTMISVIATILIYPPASVALYILLMVILTIYSYKCKSTKFKMK